jgi:hypothetical protein
VTRRSFMAPSNSDRCRAARSKLGRDGLNERPRCMRHAREAGLCLQHARKLVSGKTLLDWVTGAPIESHAE